MTTKRKIQVPIPAGAFIDPCPTCGRLVRVEGHEGGYDGAALCNSCTYTARLADTLRRLDAGAARIDALLAERAHLRVVGARAHDLPSADEAAPVHLATVLPFARGGA